MKIPRRRRHRHVEPITGDEPIEAVIARVRSQARATGSWWGLTGLGHACADCTAHASLTVDPDSGVYVTVHHDRGYPAQAGVVEWRTG